MKLKFIIKAALLTVLLTISVKINAQITAASSIGETPNTLNYTNLSVNEIQSDTTGVNTDKKAKRVPPRFVRRIKLTAGLFIPVNNTKIEVGNESGSFGTTIDFEDDLGFEKSTSTFLSDMQ